VVERVMANDGLNGSGSQSPTSLSRTIEKVFDESQYTGEINLSGRKLKEYPKCARKYDLVDTTSAGNLVLLTLSRIPVWRYFKETVHVLLNTSCVCVFM